MVGQSIAGGARTVAAKLNPTASRPCIWDAKRDFLATIRDSTS